MVSGEATNTDLIVFGVNRSGHEHTIYCTRGEHDNQYTNLVCRQITMLIEFTLSVRNKNMGLFKTLRFNINNKSCLSFFIYVMSCFITFMDKMSKTSFVGNNIMGYVYFCMRETDNH